MATIKLIKTSNETDAYDLGAKYDVSGNEITTTYATKSEALLTSDTLKIYCGTSTILVDDI